MTSWHTRAGSLALGAAAITLCIPAATADAAAVIPWWSTPGCTSVSGDGAFSFTEDDGHHIAATTVAITPQAYSHLASLGRANSLVGVTKNTIQVSRDAGCSWTVLATPRNLSQYYVVPAGRDTAYVYGINDQPVYRVSGDAVEVLAGPIEDDGFAGLAADPQRADHLVAVDKEGRLYRSGDGAATWDLISQAPVGSVYDAAIDPADIDHIVLGTGGVGTVTTFDGGRQWTRSRGVGTQARSNAFTVAISPQDPMVVWAEGYDLRQTGNGARHIWRSVDGGLHFRSVLDGTQVKLYNGTNLWPSPADTDVVYFEFGTYFSGTDLYRYDAGSGAVSSTHSNFDGIDSLSFSPADPTVMYLGLCEEQFD
jgi:photosystem II stability/assembly factor-like uncharacterized protein